MITARRHIPRYLIFFSRIYFFFCVPFSKMNFFGNWSSAGKFPWDSSTGDLTVPPRRGAVASGVRGFSSSDGGGANKDRNKESPQSKLNKLEELVFEQVDLRNLGLCTTQDGQKGRSRSGQCGQMFFVFFWVWSDSGVSLVSLWGQNFPSL